MKRILLGAALAALLWSLALQLGPAARLAGLSDDELTNEGLAAERARLRQGTDSEDALARIQAVTAERRRRFAWKAWAFVGLSLGALAVWIGHRAKPFESAASAEDERLKAFLQPSFPEEKLAPDRGSARLSAAQRLFVQPNAPREVIEAAYGALIASRPAGEHAELRAAREVLNG